MGFWLVRVSSMGKQGEKTGRQPNGHFVAGHRIGKATRFKPGRSGNPSGRPKKSALDYALESILELPSGKKNRRIVDELARALIRQAIKGNARVARLISERIGGKPLQRVEAKVGATSNDPAHRTARIKELLKKARS